MKINTAEDNHQTEVIEDNYEEDYKANYRANINENITIMPDIPEYSIDAFQLLNSNLTLLLDQNKINDLADKFDKNTLTDKEKKYIKDFYNDLINYGGMVFPEAGLILKQYIYGSGGELKIKSNYFIESQMIRNILDKNKGIEIIGPVMIRTNEDPRIGYAINGFYIKNTENPEIYQYIEFAERNNKEAYTPFELYGRSTLLPHRLIRVFEEDNGCKGFTIRITN
jgi:hypothetical protein